MAQITRPLASFNDGQVQINLTYNDANLNIGKASAVNNSDHSAEIRVVKVGPPVIDQIFTLNPHSEVSHNLPRGLAFVWKWQEGDDVHGEPLGYQLSLGDIEFYCRWPA